MPEADPFARLELLDTGSIVTLARSRDATVAAWENAFQELPPAEPDRSFARLHVEEGVQRQRAIREEVRRGMVYRDDFTFGTAEVAWFAERGAELVRVHEDGIWALVLLEAARYPQLAQAAEARKRTVGRIEQERAARAAAARTVRAGFTQKGWNRR